jgi:hypothetical protein
MMFSHEDRRGAVTVALTWIGRLCSISLVTPSEHYGMLMLVDTMIPEAFEQTHEFAGLITVAGFLAAFVLSKIGG